MTAWTRPADSPEVPAERWCPYLDQDGQRCVLDPWHAGDHQDSGLRAWLEATGERAFIRTYRGASAQLLADQERPLIASFGYALVAGEVADEPGAHSAAAVLVLGSLAALAKPSAQRRITVCYARGWE